MKRNLIALAFGIAVAGSSAQTVYTVETPSRYTMTDPAKLEESTVIINDNGVESSAAFADVAFAADSVFRKRGTGFLESTTAFGSFTGEIRIEEGGMVLTDDGQLGPSSADTAPGLVISNGAMLVFCNTDAGKAGKWRYYNPMTVGGSGVDGMGAVRNISTVSARSVIAGNITLSDDTLFYGAGKDWGVAYYLTIDYRGHTLSFEGSPDKANNFALNAPTQVNPGNIELRSMNGRILMQDSVNAFNKGDASNSIFIRSGSQLQGYNAGRLDGTWTIFAENDSAISFNNSNLNYGWDYLQRNVWLGPVQIDGLFKVQHGLSGIANTFSGVVSGDGESTLKIIRGYLNMTNPDNDFEGSLVVDPGSSLSQTAPPGVNLWADGAIPGANTNGITVNDGTLAVKASERVSLPKVQYRVSEGTNMVFSGIVGGQVASMRKTGAGRLDFTAPFCVTGRTELLEGTLKIAPMPQDVYSLNPGLRERYYVVPEADRTESKVKTDYEPVWYTDPTAWDTADPADIVTCVTNFPSLGQEYQGRWGVRFMFARYDGYIWNRTDEDVTWSFVLAFCKAAKIIIDGEVVVSQSYWKNIAKGDVTLSPGPHTFTALFCANAYTLPGARCSEMLPDGTTLLKDVIGTNWKANFGCVYDPQGRASNNPADYVIPTNGVSSLSPGGDGILFTLDDKKLNETDPAELAALRASFSNLVCSAGTVLDLNQPGYDFPVPAFEGFTTVTNGNLVLPGIWVAAEDDIVEGAKLRIDGKLKFGDAAEFRLAGTARLPYGEYVLVEAADGIEGIPTLESDGVAYKKLSVQTSDGVTRLCLSCSKGLAVVIR